MPSEYRQSPQQPVQQAIIRGPNIDLRAILSQHGLTGDYVVEHPNGITAYFHQGPMVLEQIHSNSGEDPQDHPGWDSLTHSEQRTVLESVAGSVPWAMDQELVPEGVDEAFGDHPNLARVLGWSLPGSPTK